MMLIDLALDGVLWFQTGLALGLAAALLRARRRGPDESWTQAGISTLNLCYGCIIGMLGAGHLTAITINAIRGALSNPLWAAALYPLGLALLVPAWGLVGVSGRGAEARRSRRTVMALNGWLAAVLLVSSGGKNPLAIPAVLNMVTLAVSRRWVYRAAIAVTVLLYVAMGIASLGASSRQF